MKYKKVEEKVRKSTLSWKSKMKTKTLFVSFFKCLLNFKAHALQSELSKVSIFNFVEFQLQSMSSKVERAFEKN